MEVGGGGGERGGEVDYIQAFEWFYRLRGNCNITSKQHVFQANSSTMARCCK